MAAVASTIKQIDYTFLQQNSCSDNLQRLSNPQLSTLSKTGCITREIQKITPRFKPTRAKIQAFSAAATTLFTLGPLRIGIVHGTIRCMGLKDWRSNFFSVANECLVQKVSQMIDKDHRASLIFRLLVPAIWGIGTYTILRFSLRDSKEKTRIQMLRTEYSAIADHLSDLAKTTDLPSQHQVKTIASHLKANLPYIQKQLQNTARIDSNEATIITHKLTCATNRILGISQ